MYGEVRWCDLSANDLPTDHDSHDLDIYVKLHERGAARSLNSSANLIGRAWYLEPQTAGGPHLEQLMSVEWESRLVDQRFWPCAGDHIWLTGNYCWDCGHPHLDDNDKVLAYRTEIHPPTAMALTREVPYKWPGESAFARTNKCYVYIHGRGGFMDTPVAKNYDFVIDLPEPPAPGLEPRFAVLESKGGPAPMLALQQNRKQVRVTYALAGTDADPYGPFTAVIAAGWPPSAAAQFRELRVMLDSISVLKSHDDFCAARWVLYVRVNGTWIKIPGLNAVNEADPPKAINRVVDVVVPINGTLVLQTSGWKDNIDFLFQKGLSGADLTKYLENHQFNDHPNITLGMVYECHSGPGFGIGDHHPTSRQEPDIDKKDDLPDFRDFVLHYRVQNR